MGDATINQSSVSETGRHTFRIAWFRVEIYIEILVLMGTIFGAQGDVAVARIVDFFLQAS